MHRKLQYSRVKACHGLHGPYVMAYHGLLGPRDGLSRSSRSITVFAVIDAGTTFMLIASRLDQEPIVNGVKSKIRKKPAGKLSPCSEYDPASFQNSSEDQAIRMGPEHTICSIYQLFRKFFGWGRRWRFCGIKGSFGPSMFGQLEGPLHFRSMAASLSTLGRGTENS